MILWESLTQKQIKEIALRELQDLKEAELSKYAVKITNSLEFDGIKYDVILKIEPKEESK